MRSVKRTKSGDATAVTATPNNKSPAKKNSPTNGGGVMGWSDTHRLLFAGMILFIFVDHFYLRSQLIVVSQSVVANNNATRNIHTSNHSTAAAAVQRREEEKETTSTSTITAAAEATISTANTHTPDDPTATGEEKTPVVPAVPVQETETTTTTPTEPIYLTPSQRRNRKKWERQKRAQQQQQQLQEDSAVVPPPESINTPESTTDTTVSTPESITMPETESAGAPPMETEQPATTTETSSQGDVPVITTADTTTLGTTEAITTTPETAESAAADTDSTLSAEAPSIETEQPATTTETSTAEDATTVVEPPPVDTTTVPPPPPPPAKKPKKKKKGRRGRNKKENHPPPVEQEPPQQQEQQQPIMTLLSNNADLENMQALSNMTGVPMPTEQQLTPETKMIFLKDTIYWLLRHNEAKQLDNNNNNNNSNNSNNIRVPTIPKEKDTFMGITLGQLKKYHPAIFQRIDAVTLVTILQDLELASGNRTTSTTTTTTDPASTTTSNATSTTTTPADTVDATKEIANPIATATSMPNNNTTSPPSTITYRTTNSHNDRLVAQINNYHANHNNGTYNYNYTQLELQHYQNHFNKLMRLRKTDIQVFEARGGWKFFFEHVDAYMVSSKDLDYHLEQKQVVTNHDSPVLGNRLNNHLIHVPKHKTSLCHAARIFNQFREHPDTIAQNKSWPHVLLFGLHEDNGGLSGKINGETVGFNRDGEWKKAGCKPRDIIKYLDHPDTIAAITCQWHFRIDHPKTYSIALGMRFRTQAEAAYSVIKKLKPPTDPSWNHRPRKLMLNFNVRGGNRERAMQQIRTNFVNSTSVSTQQSWGGSPKRNLEGYFEQLSEAKFILSPGGAGFDCYRNWEALFMGVVPIIEMVGRSPDGWLRTFNDLPVLVVESFADLTPEMLEEKYLQVLQSWHLFNWEKLTFHWWIHWVYQFLEDNNLPYTRPNAGKPTWGISKVGGSLIK